MGKFSRSDIEQERFNRIRVAAAAYAYEFLDDPIMSDAEFDSLCHKIRPDVSTVEPRHRRLSERRRIERLDDFFRTTFSPHTGQWVRQHPDLDRLRRVVEIFREHNV